MSKNYIGLACTGHENAIAIVDADGRVVFAEATERFLQNKRAINTPPDDILRIPKLLAAYVDPQAELVVAKSWSRAAAAAMQSDAALMMGAVAGVDPTADRDWITRVMFHMGLWNNLIGPNCQLAGTGVARYCNTHYKKLTVREYNHHLTHAAYAAFASPFEDAVCMVVDGYGEGVSHSYYAYRAGKLEPIVYPRSEKNRFGSLSSLGLYYGYTICSLFGLEITNGEEWKVMGLAPYGGLNPEFLAVLRRHIRVDGLDFVMDDNAAASYRALQAFARRPGQPLDDLKDIAYTAQYHFSELLFEILGRLHAMGISDNLVFSGGCALNSSFNGDVTERSGFKNLFVPPAPSDDGNAVGAALLAHRQDHPGPHAPSPLHSPYLGSRIDDKELAHYLNSARMLGQVDVEPKDLCRYVAQEIAAGKVIAWVQGRAEFGPRALGNRSILADPRDAGMKERINSIVKFREGFRPFAPSILHAHGDAYFENYSLTPYMEKTLRIRPEKRAEIPAVCHVDHTGRLQSVLRESNPRYHELISEFHALTGTPVLLNTSLNVMGKPIVHGAGDAFGIFLSSRIDILVIDDLVFSKSPAKNPRTRRQPPDGHRLISMEQSLTFSQAAPARAAQRAYSSDRADDLRAVLGLGIAEQYRLLAGASASEARLFLAEAVLHHAERIGAADAPGADAMSALRRIAGRATRRLDTLWAHCDSERSTFSNLRLFVDACERLLPRVADVRNFEVAAAHELYFLVESSTLFDASHDLRSAARQFGYGGSGEPRLIGALLSHKLLDDEALLAASIPLALSLYSVEHFAQILGFAFAMCSAAAALSVRQPHARTYRAARRRALAAVRAHGAQGDDALAGIRHGAALFDHCCALLVEAARETGGKIRARAVEILESKSRYAMLHHQAQSLGGRRLVEWFSDEKFEAQKMLDALAASPWIDPQNVDESRFFTNLMGSGGRMYGVFSPKEIAALKSYFKLAHDPAEEPHGQFLADYARSLAERREGLNLVSPTERKRHAGLRESYHALLNVERQPFALAIAAESIRKNLGKFEALRGAIETVDLFKTFDFSAQRFTERISAIYYHQAKENESVDLSFDFDALRTLHLYFSPFALVDGCWLKEASAARQHSETAALLTRIFADEIGNSRHEHNHANVYRRLLDELEWDIGTVDSLAYAMDERIPSAAYKAPAFLLALNLLQADHYPELLGVNLAIEMSGLDGFYAAMIRDLERLGHSADFWRLHISIDNFSTGHSQQSVEAIVKYLDDVRGQHGETVMQAVWQRVWNGLMTMLYLFGIEFKVLYGARKNAVQ